MKPPESFNLVRLTNTAIVITTGKPTDDIEKVMLNGEVFIKESG